MCDCLLFSGNHILFSCDNRLCYVLALSMVDRPYLSEVKHINLYTRVRLRGGGGGPRSEERGRRWVENCFGLFLPILKTFVKKRAPSGSITEVPHAYKGVQGIYAYLGIRGL